MQKYILFTKTYWSEPPRLRHQIANLLHKFGSEIIFFEHPNHVYRKSKELGASLTKPRFRTERTQDRILYRLRVLAPFECMHVFFTKNQINSKLKEDNIQDAIIINFNYDYYFLRDIFPHQKIITIINDNFISQAIPGYEKYVTSSLAKTCAQSDAVLTVSYPLMKQLSAWCNPTLFLPWSDTPYLSPNHNSNRNSVLIWASLSDVIDYDLLSNIANKCINTKFYMVGPVSELTQNTVSALVNNNKNIIHLPPTDLENLPNDIFFAGLMPYKAGVTSTESVTLANKSLRLMSKGLPLIVHGMPNFYEHSAIFSCSNLNQIIKSLIHCENNFFQMQSSIQDLVSKNTPEVRYIALTKIIEETKNEKLINF